jgi:hypothetical protein
MSFVEVLLSGGMSRGNMKCISVSELFLLCAVCCVLCAVLCVVMCSSLVRLCLRRK